MTLVDDAGSAELAAARRRPRLEGDRSTAMKVERLLEQAVDQWRVCAAKGRTGTRDLERGQMGAAPRVGYQLLCACTFAWFARGGRGAPTKTTAMRI